MTNLRDKYRPTSIKVMKKRVTQEDAELNQGNGFLKLTDGKNRIRFFPSHDPDSNFYVLRGFFWVKNKADDDSGDEYYNRTVLNARHHYPGAKMDLVEDYVAWATRHITNSDADADEKSGKIDALTNWKTGLNMSKSWVAYALKITGDNREFGLVELNKTLRDKINSEALTEDEDNPIEVDPFTDPDEGKVVIITVDKSKPKADQKYTIKVGQPNPLTEDELEVFDSSKHLSELFRYGVRDWEAGLEGLKIFDDMYDIGLFGEDDWTDHVEEIKAQFNFSATKKGSAKASDDDDDDAPAPKKAAPAAPAKSAAKKAIQEEEEDEPDQEQNDGDEFAGMSREELKMWIAERIEEDEDAADTLRVKKSMTDDDIREMIRTYLSGADDNSGADDEEETPPPPPAKTTAKPAGAANVQDIRDRLKGIKKG